MSILHSFSSWIAWITLFLTDFKEKELASIFWLISGLSPRKQEKERMEIWHRIYVKQICKASNYKFSNQNYWSIYLNLLCLGNSFHRFHWNNLLLDCIRLNPEYTIRHHKWTFPHHILKKRIYSLDYPIISKIINLNKKIIKN